MEPAPLSFPCPFCGKHVWISPAIIPGDAMCPDCGHLIRLDAGAVEQRLSELGALVETDDEGEVRTVRFVGPAYNDAAIGKLAQLRGIQRIVLRETAITPRGVERLRQLLPETRIEYEDDPH